MALGASLRQLRAVLISLATLDLHKDRKQEGAPALLEVAVNRFALRLQAETAPALLSGADPGIGNEEPGKGMGYCRVPIN